MQIGRFGQYLRGDDHPLTAASMPNYFVHIFLLLPLFIVRYAIRVSHSSGNQHIRKQKGHGF
jgi:hypothetical protein